MKPLKWGIVGPGAIAKEFVLDLLWVPGNEIRAVASRSLDRAKEFAKSFEGSVAYGSYAALFADPEVDIVYVATPHHDHMQSSIAAMNAGKAVLCEKPVAVNVHQLQQMIQASERNKVFFMEALWTRFNPSVVAALKEVRNGSIGQVNYIQADFSFFIEEARHAKLMNPERAGGSLLEMGIYPVFLAYLFMGKPREITASALLHENGCDWQTAASLQYETGLAQVMSGFLSESDMVARIHGEKGRIELHRIWHETQGYTRVDAQRNSHTVALPTLGKGFTYEIMACQEAMQQGWISHPDWSHQNSLELMQTLDEIRAKAGIHYQLEETVDK